MAAALAIAAKDLRQRLRDRSAILIAVVVPLVLAAIFGLILPDSGRTTFSFALVDSDHGAAAEHFAAGVLEPLQRDGVVELHVESTQAKARRLLDRREAAAAFVLPAGFSAAVGSGRPAHLEVLGSVDAPIGTLVAQSIAQGYASRLTGIRVATAALAAPVAAAGEPPIRIDDITTAQKELDGKSFYAAGMAVFFLFFTVQYGVSSLLEERRDGTLARMLVAPIRRSSLLVGKLLTSVLLGFLSMVVLVLATHFLLGAHWGEPLGVGILIAAGILAATAVMALVATLAKTADQAGAWQSMLAVVLGMLGGSFFPVGRSGGVLEQLSLITPHAWFLRGVQELAAGGGVGVALAPVGAMLAFAAVTGGLALLRLGKLVEP